LKQELTLEDAAAQEDMVNSLHGWVLTEQAVVTQLSECDLEMRSSQEMQRQADQVPVEPKDLSYWTPTPQIVTVSQADKEGISLETPKSTKPSERHSVQRSSDVDDEGTSLEMLTPGKLSEELSQQASSEADDEKSPWRP